MSIVQEGQLAGDFEGFNDEITTFEFSSGGKWRQARYHYHYAYMPRAKVILEAGRHVLYVSGVSKGIEVERVF